MPIFISHVTLTKEGVQAIKNVTERIEENKKIWDKIRTNASPRHVPAKIIKVDDIPPHL